MSSHPKPAGELVREVIERDGVVRNGLARGLVNHRALARWIQDSAPTDASFDALLGAIRRYPIQQSTAARQFAGGMILELSLKNKIVVISLRNEKEVQKAIARFSEEVNYANGETFRVVTSMEAVSVTLDSKNAGKLEGRVSKSQVLRRLDGLAEVLVTLELDAEKASGVISTIASELAANDVNIRQLTSVGPSRVIVLVDEGDALGAYRSLEALGKAQKK